MNVIDIELKLLLEAIYLKYGYDFRKYTSSSIQRRFKRILDNSDFDSFSEMQHSILRDDSYFASLLPETTISVTEMFRDPTFYKAVREAVIPELAKLELVKVWHAGCASGEEVYSMAILLKEAGIYDKCRIYATDIDETVLKQAKEGIYKLENLRLYIENYRASGGIEPFTDYYSSSCDAVKIEESLKKNILFSCHNLVTDSVFSEMDLIICRNVLIYFNRELQDRVFKLFRDSLHHSGIMCLGSRESVRFSSSSSEFEDMLESARIYKVKSNTLCK